MKLDDFSVEKSEVIKCDMKENEVMKSDKKENKSSPLCDKKENKLSTLQIISKKTIIKEPLKQESPKKVEKTKIRYKRNCR